MVHLKNDAQLSVLTKVLRVQAVKHRACRIKALYPGSIFVPIGYKVLRDRALKSRSWCIKNLCVRAPRHWLFEWMFFIHGSSFELLSDKKAKAICVGWLKYRWRQIKVLNSAVHIHTNILHRLQWNTNIKWCISRVMCNFSDLLTSFVFLRLSTEHAGSKFFIWGSIYVLLPHEGPIETQVAYKVLRYRALRNRACWVNVLYLGV